MKTTSENHSFARLILSLEPWLHQVVIIGGWAHRLYRLDPRAQQLEHDPIRTLDADVAIPSLQSVKGADIRQRLLSNGFQEELVGDDQPPATHYSLGTDETGFYAEFLTPLTGSEYTRLGKRKATMRVAGVVSQRLRYLELLLMAPWTVSLDESNGFPFPQAKRVRIANPTTFLAHKVLVHAKRPPGKSYNDILYIHDTLETFGGRLDDLRNEWIGRVKPEVRDRNVRVIERAWQTLFGEMTDSVRQAARIAISSGRKLSPEAILEVCSVGLKEIFGSRRTEAV
ncbi:MAG: nucleotidyltransferase domain-containing protein [Acidobacteria bacterium]|nr:nucleotidyltransferase domain-containing protein [Acidobacteriota bacterium]